MTIVLLAVEIKHERRLRLVFSQPLGAGAFGTPGPAYYTVTSLDSLGVSPAVSSALMVVTSPDVVELALDEDLVRGGLYEVEAVTVPALDASVTAAGSSEQFRYGLTAVTENVEPIKRDRERLLYGVDLLWNGADYQEAANGDLDTVGGTANVTKALYRNMESNGLPWDPTWGVGAREFVDSPSTVSGSLRGKMSSQLLRDPRVKELTIAVEFDDDKTYLHATPKLITGEAIKPVSLLVPSDA